MTAIAIQSLKFSEARTWMFASLFIAGNILLPALVHMVPGGGPTWLPIYFFTLIGAYLYGWRVGLLTALLSPLVNSMLTGMPPVAALPAIMEKSTLLAFAASVVAHRLGKVTLGALALVIVAYQLVGSMIEWGITLEFSKAVQDVVKAWPGLLVQLVGGWILLSLLTRDKE